MKRIDVCANCHTPMFRFFGRGWFHAYHSESRGKFYRDCLIQNAVGYHPVASLTKTEIDKTERSLYELIGNTEAV